MKPSEITYEPLYHGIELKGGTHEPGWYLPALDRAWHLLVGMLNAHSKVFYMQVTINNPVDDCWGFSNDRIEQFRHNLITGLKRQQLDPLDMWAREFHRDFFNNGNSYNNAHWHYVLILNGNEIQMPHNVISEIFSQWSMVLGRDASGLVNYRNGDVDTSGIMLRRDRPQECRMLFENCFSRMSYLAKVAGKMQGYGRNFGGSRIQQQAAVPQCLQHNILF